MLLRRFSSTLAAWNDCNDWRAALGVIFPGNEFFMRELAAWRSGVPPTRQLHAARDLHGWIHGHAAHSGVRTVYDRMRARRDPNTSPFLTHASFSPALMYAPTDQSLNHLGESLRRVLRRIKPAKLRTRRINAALMKLDQQVVGGDRRARKEPTAVDVLRFISPATDLWRSKRRRRARIFDAHICA